MGRVAKYRNAAEKQQAYRSRLQQQQHANDEANWLLAEFEKRSVTLRNMVARMKTPELRLSDSVIPHFALLEGGYHRLSFDPLLCDFMVRRGELELLRETWSGKFYQLVVR